ncbi:MAG: TIGR01212 family radical SAM protein [Lachnospiraceae bacterium]|nr:TIGR01212 family radical SAM protein [Lachnospiraceae bacterium]
MTTLNQYLQSTFGCKVYKIALNGGFTCPNRDGTLGSRGCIFCSEGGSGEFAESPKLSITEQIENGKKRVLNKVKDGKYIAYFQAYTGTYAPIEKLRKLYTEAVKHPDIVVLSIGTRPDCLPKEVLSLLEELNRIKPVWVELGLQTIHEKTAEYIRRGYPLTVYDNAVNALRERKIDVITHVILGLPGESREDMLETVRYVCDSGAAGIKLQLLHILKGTDLEKEYFAGRVRVMTEYEYISLIGECVRLIPDNIIIHRLTGDGDKRLLVAPLWSGNKKHVLNRLRSEVLS